MHGLYEAVRNHDFSESTCFLCGSGIDEKNRTDEHIIPKWLLKEFDLWNVTIHLINGTRIPYRKLVIPCCSTCNNNHLSSIEDEVQKAFRKGSKGFEIMDREVLMVWVTKIFYGLLYREIFLTFDRRKPELGKIVSREDMEQFVLLHYILQSARVPMLFNCMESNVPCTIFTFDVKEPKNPLAKFDYKDDVVHRALYLRMDRVGLLAAFDMGAQKFEGSTFFPRYQKEVLHPVQFEELGAWLFAKARKFRRNPKVMLSENEHGVQFNVMPIAGLSSAPVFEDIELEEIAEAKMFFLGYPKEAIMPAEGLIATWLRNEDGGFKELPMDFPPWN